VSVLNKKKGGKKEKENHRNVGKLIDYSREKERGEKEFPLVRRKKKEGVSLQRDRGSTLEVFSSPPSSGELTFLTSGKYTSTGGMRARPSPGEKGEGGLTRKGARRGRKKEKKDEYENGGPCRLPVCERGEGKEKRTTTS